MEYISYLDIPRHWGLEKGDVVLLSSDITKLVYVSLKHRERFDINLFIDAILDVIGKESGTLMLPTYNWDFCHGTPFDYYSTPCLTGDLGSSALRRKDFKRTKHALYSFAVAGKYQDLLCGMDNISSFGSDSPFSFLEMIKAKNVIIDVKLNNCFTFVHYVEQRAGISNYRYNKMFKGQYRDENGTVSEREFSMLVRDLQDYYETNLDPLEDCLKEAGVQKSVRINDISFSIVDFYKAYPIIMDDILNNQSRKLCKHKWQNG